MRGRSDRFGAAVEDPATSLAKRIREPGADDDASASVVAGLTERPAALILARCQSQVIE
jgi:hypothetical protein